jgi:hypothetical protein
MSMILTIPDALAERLATVASAASTTADRMALAAIERNVDAWERAEKSLAPVRAAFEASGLTDDELSELLEAEKHAMRRERREAGGQ